MSQFSNAVTKAIEESRLSQTELAASTGISIAQINRYARGRTDIRPKILAQLLAAFSTDHQARLIRAFLLDQVPAEHANAVTIHARTELVSEPAPDGLEDLPDDVRNALRFIGTRASEAPVRDLILDLARILRGEK